MILLEAGEPARFESVAFDPTGTRVIAGYTSARDVLVWDVSSGRTVDRLRADVVCVPPSPADEPSATPFYTLSGGVLSRSDFGTRRETAVSEPGRYVLCFAASACGRRVVWHQTRPTTGVLGELAFAHPADPEPGWRRLVHEGPGNGWLYALAFFPGGDSFVSAERFFTPGSKYEYRLAVRTADTGEAIHARTGADCECKRVAVSPAGTGIAAQHGEVLRVFTTDFASHPRKIRNDNDKHFTGIAFHPSGRYLAATSNDATVKLYDTADWQVAKTLMWKAGRMRSVAFSPDGALAAAGSDTGKVVVWDVDV